MTTDIPTGWTLAASAFNWSSEIVRAERAAPDRAPQPRQMSRRRVRSSPLPRPPQRSRKQ